MIIQNVPDDCRQLNIKSQRGFTPLPQETLAVRPGRNVPGKTPSAFRPRGHGPKAVVTGFTLIEMLIVLAIAGLITAGAVQLSGRQQSDLQLETASAQVKQILQIARQRAQGRINNQPHGVHFVLQPTGADQAALYQGSAYAARDQAYDQVVTFDTGLAITTSLPGEGVNFSLGLGSPSGTGQITISHAVTGSRLVTLNGLGLVE